MARWTDVIDQAPEVGGFARLRLDAGAHKVLATVRADGAPRVSGSEVFEADGDLWFGVMPGAMRVLDMRRDPRVALHTQSVDPDVWVGDATVSGRAEEISDATERDRVMALRGKPHPGEFHLFRIDVREVLTVRLGEPADHVVVDVWREGRGVRRRYRR